MATSSTLPGGKKHHTAGASRAAARRGKTPHPHASFCCVSISVLFSLIAPMVIFRWL